jgi:23S rRNA pseudouridine2605 synthase
VYKDVDARHEAGHDEEVMPDKTPQGERAGERIAKAMARAGLCSRREAEAWIAAGRVAVNGATITSPALNVTARDRISIDGKPLPARERTRLFLYHKPRGLVTTHADPQGRPTVFERLPADLPRLISVGRLDFNSEGLLLLTNDGGLARVLELPSTGWRRRYRARAHGTVTQEALEKLRAGIAVEGVRYGPIEATLDRVQRDNVWLTVAIREGKNREVRNVLAALGLAVNRLIRISFGPFQLGEIPPGGIEEVKARVLREQLGEKLARDAGADLSPLARPR